ncbi:MAG: type II toxin-antitoxin system RelE/ParE family toxin [Gammaproteobacteria bacterium]|nr:type II toxin-antitoxin system RelE/ParE family toxin [Gammaproteobacteria bacterium]
MTKPLFFVGSALEDLRALPRAPRREAGYQLDRVQSGLDPSNWKPVPTVGRGVREIRIHYEGQYRVIYVAKFDDAVYVLHAFQKKTRKTRKQDIEIARRRIKLIKENEPWERDQIQRQCVRGSRL